MKRKVIEKPHRLSEDVKRYEDGSRVPGWDRSVDPNKDPAQIPDPATTEVPQQLKERIQQLMARYPEPKSAAIPALSAAQDHHGWCSPEAIQQVACVMQLTPGYLISVASFYDMLETKPVGKHSIYVCTNISCSLKGADDIYRQLKQQAGDDPDLNVRHFECLGACDIAPMASVDGVYVGPLQDEDLPQLLADTKAGNPVLPEKQLIKRACADQEAGE